MSDDVVGHKTFADGPLGFRHEPLTRGEAESILAAIDADARRRAEEMPDEISAINKLFDAWLRLKELGWKEAIYCPKNGSTFQVIQAGSTGVFDAHYRGEWPDGYIITIDGIDSYASRPGEVMLCKTKRAIER